MTNVQGFLAACEKVLRSRGGRVTKSRLEVLSLIAAARQPQSQSCIRERLKKSGSKGQVDRVTLLRMLQDFVEAGLLHRLVPSGDYIACSHLSCNHHHHAVLSCEDCGESNEIELTEKSFAPIVAHLHRTHGFLLKNHHFQLFGLCKNCR